MLKPLTPTRSPFWRGEGDRARWIDTPGHLQYNPGMKISFGCEDHC